MADEVKKATEKTIPVTLLRNYYPADGGPKIPAGTKLDMAVSEAKKAIDNGVASRNDPLPQ